MKKLLMKMAEAHKVLAAAHSGISKMHGEACEKSEDSFHRGMRDLHAAAADAHVAICEGCIGEAKEMIDRGGGGSVDTGALDGPGKAVGAGNLWDSELVKARPGAAPASPWNPNPNDLVPTLVKGAHGGGRLTAVPRPGSPPLGGEGVPEQFQHLVEP